MTETKGAQQMSTMAMGAIFEPSRYFDRPQVGEKQLFQAEFSLIFSLVSEQARFRTHLHYPNRSYKKARVWRRVLIKT